MVWTEKAKAQQYDESLDIDRDPGVKDKWLERARLLAKRRERAVLRFSVAEDIHNNGNGDDALHCDQMKRVSENGNLNGDLRTI